MASTLELVELVEDIQAVKARARNMWLESADYKLDMDMRATYGEGSAEAYTLGAVNQILGALQPGLMMLVRKRVPRMSPQRWDDIAGYVRERLRPSGEEHSDESE